MSPADGEPETGEGPAGETTPAGQTRVADTPQSQTRVSDRPPAETRVAETPAAQTPAAQTPVAQTRVAETPPPVAPSPPGTDDPIVLDPAPAAVVDTAHAEPLDVGAILLSRRPELFVGAAFVAGLLAAKILRRLGR